MPMYGRNKYLGNLLVAGAILALGLFFHLKHLRDLPSHVHAWAQADRYALALGFINNGFDLWHPETFTFNHQFPNDWKTADATSITAVDAPLHEFAIAAIMHITGNSGPAVFRLYALIYACLGLFFFFRLALLLTADVPRAFLATLFAATSPVFVYYQAGFLPSIPSLANAIIGLYLYLRFVREPRFRLLAWAVVFLALAALTRTTYVIPLGAVLVAELWRLLNKRTGPWAWRWPFVVAVLILVGQHLHNRALTQAYGSIFLDHFLPPRSLEEARGIWTEVIANWGTQYFSVMHYVLSGATLLGACIALLMRRSTAQRGQDTLLLLVALMLGASALFAALMWQQFPAHDYYFLDTFFLPICLLFVWALSVIQTWRYGPATKTFALLTAGAIGVPLVLNAVKTQEGRMATGPWDDTANSIANFTGGDTLLDALGVAKSAKVLVLNTHAPNLPFILLNRKGYALMGWRAEDIQLAMEWDADVVVIQNNAFLAETWRNYPEITHYLKKIGDNGRISVCVPISPDTARDLYSFMGVDASKPVLHARITAPEGTNPAWSILPADSGMGSGRFELDSKQEYALSFRTENLPGLDVKPRLVSIHYRLLRRDDRKCELILTLNGTREGFYKNIPLNGAGRPVGSWAVDSAFLELPISPAGTVFDLYLWNPGASEIVFEDLEFAVY